MEKNYQAISSLLRLVAPPELSLILPLSLIDSENITDAQLYKVLSWRMVVEVELLHLTLRESSSSMNKCLQEAFSEEELPNSVWPYSKDLDGIFQTTAMLNPISTVKVKAAVSLLVLAAALTLNLMSSVQVVSVDVLPMVEEVEAAAVIPSWTDADLSDLLKIMTAKTKMVRIMQDFPVYKFSEEELVVDASLVT